MSPSIPQHPKPLRSLPMSHPAVLNAYFSAWPVNHPHSIEFSAIALL